MKLGYMLNALRSKVFQSEAISYSVASLKLSMNLYFLLKEIVNLTKQMGFYIECSDCFRMVRKCLYKVPILNQLLAQLHSQAAYPPCLLKEGNIQVAWATSPLVSSIRHK